MGKVKCGTMAAVLLLLSVSGLVSGHGRLLKPPARASMWRAGFSTPINYNDNALFCGGFRNQYVLNGGKCGICGDPYQGPRDNEAGGKYATGTIGRKYSQGQTIDITVEVTANHLGWFEFKLCPNNDPKKAATQDCLDRHVLQKADGTGSKLYIGTSLGMVSTKLRLPADVTCSQCVLQWRWRTGHSYGFRADGNSCLGCGDQEEFYGCADVAIGNPGTGSQLTNPGQIGTPAQTNPGLPNPGQIGVPTPGPQGSVSQGGQTPPSFIPQGNNPQGQGGSGNGVAQGGSGNGVAQGGSGNGGAGASGVVQRCRAISPLWRGQPAMDSWCQYNCVVAHNCPGALCSCTAA